MLIYTGGFDSRPNGIYCRIYIEVRYPLTFGITFEHHRRGNCPYHYSGHIGPARLEIYPMAREQERPDITLRLGLALDAFDEIIDKLNALNTTSGDFS